MISHGIGAQNLDQALFSCLRLRVQPQNTRGALNTRVRKVCCLNMYSFFTVQDRSKKYDDGTF